VIQKVKTFLMKIPLFLHIPKIYAKLKLPIKKRTVGTPTMADTTEYHGHRGHGLKDILLNNKISDAEQAVLAAIAASGNSVAQADLENALTIIQNLNRVSSDLGTAIERNGSDGRATTERTSADIRTELAQTDSRLGSTIERTGAEGAPPQIGLLPISVPNSRRLTTAWARL
jgi:hypothetical protein